MHILVNDVTTNLSDRFRSEGSISVSEPKALCNRAIKFYDKAAYNYVKQNQ